MQTPERATELLTMAVEFLAMVPSHVWDHRSLPVPIEDIADSHLSLLVRDVDDVSARLPVLIRATSARRSWGSSYPSTARSGERSRSQALAPPPALHNCPRDRALGSSP